MQSQVIDRWHQVLRERDLELLHELLAEDAVFHSPVMHAPQKGRQLAWQYLAAAGAVLLTDSFRYVREIVTEDQAALEFAVTLDEVEVNGVDLIRWNESQQITDFKVMLRPLQGIHKVQERMAEFLKSGPGQ